MYKVGTCNVVGDDMCSYACSPCQSYADSMMYDLRDLLRKALHHTNIGMPLMDSHNPIHQICSVTVRLHESCVDTLYSMRHMGLRISGVLCSNRAINLASSLQSGNGTLRWSALAQ